MTTPNLAPIAPKLAPIIARLSTNHDGERLACVAAIERLLTGQGLTFLDLADALTDARPVLISGETADHLALAEDMLRWSTLTDWERKFIRSLYRQLAAGRYLSDRQESVLTSIYNERRRAA